MAKKTTSKSSKPTDSAGLIKAIRTSTQKVYSSEQKILIVMEGVCLQTKVLVVHFSLKTYKLKEGKRSKKYES